VGPEQDADALALEVLRRLDGRGAVHEDVRQAELAVRERGNGDERYAARTLAHQAAERVLAGVDFAFTEKGMNLAVVRAVLNVEVEPLDLHRAVDDRRVQVVVGDPQ